MVQVSLYLSLGGGSGASGDGTPAGLRGKALNRWYEQRAKAKQEERVKEKHAKDCQKKYIDPEMVELVQKCQCCHLGLFVLFIVFSASTCLYLGNPCTNQGRQKRCYREAVESAEVAAS